MINFYNEKRHLRANSFAWLLGAQLFLILTPAIFEYLNWAWIEALGIVFVMFSSIYIATSTKRELVGGLIITIITTILLFLGAPNETEALGATIESKVLGFITLVLVISLFAYVGVALCKQVYRMGKIDLNTVLAAVCGYTLIGIIGGFLIRLVQLLTPGAFNIVPAADGYEYMYFSFVTITTLGYGDITPQEPVGQAIVTILVIAGQMYLTIVMALIISQINLKKS